MDDLGGWRTSAQAWIDSQTEEGDESRRDILDPALVGILGDVRGLRVLDLGCGEGPRADGIDPDSIRTELTRKMTG